MEDLAKEILKVIGDKRVVMLENHGVAAVGISLEDAYQTAKDVKWLARIQLIRMIIGKPKP